MANDELESLSVRLDTTWKSLARLLQFREAEIVAFDKDNVRLRDKAYSMLMLWKHREGSHATYQALHDALSDRRVDRRDLVERLCIDDGRPFLVST